MVNLSDILGISLSNQSGPSAEPNLDSNAQIEAKRDSFHRIFNELNQSTGTEHAQGAEFEEAQPNQSEPPTSPSGVAVEVDKSESSKGKGMQSAAAMGINLPQLALHQRALAVGRIIVTTADTKVSAESMGAFLARQSAPEDRPIRANPGASKSFVEFQKAAPRQSIRALDDVGSSEKKVSVSSAGSPELEVDRVTSLRAGIANYDLSSTKSKVVSFDSGQKRMSNTGINDSVPGYRGTRSPLRNAESADVQPEDVVQLTTKVGQKEAANRDLGRLPEIRPSRGSGTISGDQKATDRAGRIGQNESGRAVVVKEQSESPIVKGSQELTPPLTSDPRGKFQSKESPVPQLSTLIADDTRPISDQKTELLHQASALNPLKKNEISTDQALDSRWVNSGKVPSKREVEKSNSTQNFDQLAKSGGMPSEHGTRVTIQDLRTVIAQHMNLSVEVPKPLARTTSISGPVKGEQTRESQSDGRAQPESSTELRTEFRSLLRGLQSSQSPQSNESVRVYEAWTDRFAQSVSNRIHALLRSGGWHLNLRLDPANLGEINIELEMTDSGLEGRIGASDETTRQLLQDSVHRLRASMKEIVEPGQFLNLSVHKDAKNDSSRDNDRRKGSEKSEELDILAQVITQPEQRQLMRSGILDILV